MKLYTRILLSYGYLVILVLVGAAGAALGFHSLGARIGGMLEDNFQSVRASMTMLESLERQDSAVLTGLLQKESQPQSLAAAEESFEDALKLALSHVTEEQERPLLAKIATSFEAYRKARDELLAAQVERPLARYEAECYPYFEAVKVEVRRLLDLNHQAMLRADREAQSAAATRAAGYALLTAIALVSLGLLSQSLRRHIISRLDDLRAVAEAVGQGDFRRRAAEDPRDELGSVASELNRLLDAHENLRGRLDAWQSRQRDLTIGLLQAYDRPVALVDLSGDLMASTLDKPSDQGVVRAARGARQALESADSLDALRDREIDGDGRRYRFRLLLAAGQRPVAWLVEPLD